MYRLQSGYFLTMIIVASSTAATAAPDIEEYLSEGRLQNAAAAMEAKLADDPDDQQARFSLGIVQFLQAVEGLGRDHYRYGLATERGPSIVFLRLPVPENPSPERISYDDAREIVQNVVNRLAIAEQTLARVTSAEVRLPLPLEELRLDLDGDGRGSDKESLGFIIQHIQRRGRRPGNAQDEASTVVGFDAADAAWLRGYCHALSAAGEMILAYDWNDQFERTAHLFYPDVETPYEFLNDEDPRPGALIGGRNIGDLIALVHTINYEVTEPERMRKALTHWETVIALSRESWKRINAETDDDQEWLPGPHQTAVITEIRIGQELVTTWHEFLDETEAILQGRKLVPFWRGLPGAVNDVNDFPRHPTLGINVRKLFTKPGRFDAALWFQGTGLQPWLEEGDIVDPQEWNEMLRGFNNNFWPVLFWFN